jgi:hypothetical protein
MKTPTAKIATAATFSLTPTSLPRQQMIRMSFSMAPRPPEQPSYELNSAFFSGSYQFRGGLLNGSNTFTNTFGFAISDMALSIELDWSAAATTSTNNGGLTLRIDGSQKTSITRMENGTRCIDRILMGAVTGIDTGTRGTTYFGAFESCRQTYNGQNLTF